MSNTGNHLPHIRENPHYHIQIYEKDLPLAVNIYYNSKHSYREDISLSASKKGTHSMKNQVHDSFDKTLQELRMLSNGILNCQVTKIVLNSGSQLSEL